MSGCLGDYELWLAHEGEARRGDLAHLRACSTCAARRDRLADDVRAISSALQAAPPSRRRGPVVWRRWELAAALAAGLVLLAGVETAMWRHSNVIVKSPSQGSLETRTLLDDVATMLSPMDAVSPTALPSEDAGLGDEMESANAEETGMADGGAL
jgi:hypothetical protein